VGRIAERTCIIDAARKSRRGVVHRLKTLVAIVSLRTQRQRSIVTTSDDKAS